MAANLTNIGEEYALETALEGVSLTVGLYNDGTDGATDTFDLADLTTEPEDGNYSRQTITGTLEKNGDGHWQVVNSSQVSFDVSDTTGTVDAYFVVANFQSDDASDGSATDHIIITGSLAQSRDLSQLDTLNISASGVGAEID